MIRSVTISNFRCFQKLDAGSFSRINLVSGDNGAGKTALLEAIFLTLCSTPEKAIQFRQQRGLEGAFSGVPAQVERALWSGLFYNSDMSKPISIVLSGDGPEARSVFISRGESKTLIPLDESISSPGSTGMVFEWTSAAGQTHRYQPRVSQKGIEIQPSEEDLPEFFMFPAAYMPSASENAARFSELSFDGKEEEFIGLFRREYPWIKDLSIQVVAGQPVLHASLEGNRKIPVNEISSGINRMVGILLAIASRPRSVVIVDEVENGVYYEHHAALWRFLIDFSRKFNSQLFLSTHSREWIEALFEYDNLAMDEISYFRVRRGGDSHSVKRFTGKELELGIRQGSEVR